MSSKIRWAIIGIGKFSNLRGGYNAIAYAHAEGIKRNSDKFELVAGASLEQQNLDDFKREYPCNTYLDMNELLQTEKPDGVTISTYAPAREEHVLAAIRAGVKYVFIEKPLALSFAAMQNMKSEAEKYGARLFVNFQRRYGKPFEWARETALSGKIGRVYQVDLYQPFSNLLDFGPHFINSALYFLDNPEPLSVVASADEEGQNPWHGMFVEKRMDATVYFKNDVRFNVTASPDNSMDAPLIRINGDKGFVELYMGKKEGMQSVFCRMTADGYENPACDENFHHGDTDKYLYFERCYADIANAVETNAPSRVDLVHGMLTQEILLAIYSSAQNGKRVSFAEKITEPVFKFS